MTNESHWHPRWQAWRATDILAALLATGILASCAIRTPAPDAAPVRSAAPAVLTSDDPVCPAAGTREPPPIDALIAYHGAVRRYGGIARLRANALGAPGEGAFARMCHAIVLSEPGAAADLPRTWTLLRAVLTAEDGDALAVRPLARILAENVQERLRLARLIARLDTQLQANEKARAALQQKLDALTEIERSLPARPSPDSTLPPPPTDTVPGRNTQ
ncbi:MAG: hypothetical protein Q7J47_20935 [Azoarcus sp.]|nr:hypothetical protein [Azoarcus sp.]